MYTLSPVASVIISSLEVGPYIKSHSKSLGEKIDTYINIEKVFLLP